jgi:hypothetical protein
MRQWFLIKTTETMLKVHLLVSINLRSFKVH